MSDNWIRLVPTDPHYVPDRARQIRARARFGEIAPEGKIGAAVFDTVAFFDCGGNFEAIRCPACGAELPVEWWQRCMEEDYGAGFRLATYVLPCCGAACTLNDLGYQWPQAFGRFALEALNPGVGALGDEHKKELEEILGAELRVVYQHL